MHYHSITVSGVFGRSHWQLWNLIFLYKVREVFSRRLLMPNTIFISSVNNRHVLPFLFSSDPVWNRMGRCRLDAITEVPAKREREKGAGEVSNHNGRDSGHGTPKSTHLTQDRDKWWALVNTVMNLWVP
jgi:hypothetical protein